MFLDHLYGDFAAALKLLIQRARGDYTDGYLPASVSEVRERERRRPRAVAVI